MRVIWVFLLVLLSTFALAGPKFAKVRIVFIMKSSKGEFFNPPQKYVLTDAAKIDALVGSLTGFGSKTLPLKPAGWSARAMLELIPAKGPSTTVYVGADLVRWSMRGSTGDAKATAALKPLLEEAQRQSKPVG